MDDYERANSLNERLIAGNNAWAEASVWDQGAGKALHLMLSQLVRLIGDDEPKYLVTAIDNPDDVDTGYSVTVFTDAHIYKLTGRGLEQPVTEVLSRAGLERLFVESVRITTTTHQALAGKSRTQVRLEYPNLTVTLPGGRSIKVDAALDELLPSLIADLDK